MAGFCPKCGTARADGAEACANCQHVFATPAATPTVDSADSPSPRRRIAPKWLLIGAGVLALAGAGTWVATHGIDGIGIGGSRTVVDTSLLPVSFGGKCGYVDASGKMVINPQYDNAMAFSAKLGVAAVQVGDKWGLIDRDGKYVVNPQFENLTIDQDSDLIAVKMSGKTGTIDSAGKFLINPQFDDFKMVDSDGHIIVRLGNKDGVVDTDGKYLIPAEYDNIVADWHWKAENPGRRYNMFASPLLVIRDSKYGYIDQAGKVLVEPQFVSAGYFDTSGMAPAAIEEIDTDAFNRIRDQNANAVEALIRGRIWQWVLGDIRRDGLTMSFDLNNYTMGDQIKNWLIQNIKDGRWMVSANETRDPQGFLTGASVYLTQQLEAPKRNKYGYIDKAGKFVVPPQFADAENFSPSGLAPVQVGNVYGFVDTKGKIAINPQWAHVGSFRKVGGEWLAIVGTGEEGSDKTRWGVIDTKGTYKVNPQFDGLSEFEDSGLAIARSGDLSGAVDATGHYVLQPVYATLIPIGGTSRFVFVKAIAGAKDLAEIGVVERDGTVVTTVRGGTCGGLYSFR